jgi:hypothetical protein
MEKQLASNGDPSERLAVERQEKGTSPGHGTVASSRGRETS